MQKSQKKTIHSIDVILNSSDQKKSLGTVLIQRWSEKERVNRAFKVLAIFWGLGLISVLIPLAHFILVPGFFLAGPIVAIKVHKISEVIIRGKGVCPHCGLRFFIEKAPMKWPLSDICTACQTSVSITPQ